MKEVTIKRFEKGDFIKGKKGNCYRITNEHMTRAVVTGVDKGGSTMSIKVLEHASGGTYPTEFNVRNDDSYFELLPKVNNKAEKDNSLVITVTSEKGSGLVGAVIACKGGNIYGAHALCSPHDGFDFHTGAALAIERAWALMLEKDEEKPEKPKEPEGPVKVGDQVRVATCWAQGGLKKGDLAEVIGIGTMDLTRGVPYVYVASKKASNYDGDGCRNPGPGTLKQPFTYLNPREYEILPEQPVRPVKVK